MAQVVNSLPAALAALSLTKEVREDDAIAIVLGARQVGDKGVKALVKAILRNTRSRQKLKSTGRLIITLFDVSVCSLTDSCAEDIGTLIKEISSLKSLKLNGNFLTSLGAKMIFQALEKNESITNVQLENNRIGGHDAMEALSDCLMANHVAFRVLQIQVNQVRDAGMRSLSRGLALNRHGITQVNLWRCNIGDDGMVAFAKALHRNRTIEVANLSYNDIGDPGIYALCDALLVNESLTSIDLRHNLLTDRSIMRMIPVVTNANNTLNDIKVEHNESISSEYLINKLLDHVDLNNIGVVQRHEEKMRNVHGQRELRRLTSGDGPKT